MKITQKKKWIIVVLGLCLSATLLLGGCTNVNPITPQQPAPTTPSPSAPALPTPTAPADPTKPSNDMKDVTVIYNYTDTGKVQLSANNLSLKVGQRLILQPAKGLTKNTRFTSSGENFFSNVMKQETGPDSTKAVFTAIAPGKGRLSVIPNTTDIDRATDLWVTVQ
jgi:hypothetical protein